MFIDMHVHVSEYSPDSFLPVRAAIARAKAMGLDGLCITDHDTLGILEIIDQLRAESEFPLFAGVEYLTTDGDFSVFGLDVMPAPGMDATSLLRHVTQQGGAAVACHPYRNNGRGAGDKVRNLAKLQGVECFNGSTSRANNLKALRVARELGRTCTGASDAHHVERLGRFATRFDRPVRTTADLVQALHFGATTPVMFVDNQFVDVDTTPYFICAPEGDADL